MDTAKERVVVVGPGQFMTEDDNGTLRSYAGPLPDGAVIDTRSCTCHPDDNPPQPCARKYAFSDCVAAARVGRDT